MGASQPPYPPVRRRARTPPESANRRRSSTSRPARATAGPNDTRYNTGGAAPPPVRAAASQKLRAGKAVSRLRATDADRGAGASLHTRVLQRLVRRQPYDGPSRDGHGERRDVDCDRPGADRDERGHDRGPRARPPPYPVARRGPAGSRRTRPRSACPAPWRRAVPTGVRPAGGSDPPYRSGRIAPRSTWRASATAAAPTVVATSG